jgi:hypothetical protein
MQEPVLTGQRAPRTFLASVVETLLLAAHVYPFLLMGGAMTLAGLLALGPRKDMRGLWVCLPAGLVLLGLFAGLAYYLTWRMPRLTVTRFAYDGSEIAIEAPARGCFMSSVEDLRSVAEAHGRSRLLGWWLKFEGIGWVYLDAATPNAAELVQEIRHYAERKKRG